MKWIARLVLIFGLLNLAWEVLQLPLYTIWSAAPGFEIAYAVIHCTGGDILIGATAAVLTGAGLRLAGAGRGRWRFPACFIVLSVSYTVFSEWLNVSVRKSWAYADAMPVLPPLDTGLAPLLQWVIVPLLTWYAAGEPVRNRLAGRLA